MNELRRSVSLALAGLIFFGLSSSCFATEYVSVKKDDVNIRSGPSTNDPVIMEVSRGFPLQVQEKKGSWLRVTDFEKDSGWISKDLTDNTQTVIVVAQSSANMRQEPNTKSAKIADVEREVVFELINKKGNWRHVKHSNGTSGWLHKSLVWPQ